MTVSDEAQQELSDLRDEIETRESEHDELIRLRTLADYQAEIAGLRERKKALEIDLERAYDEMDSVKKEHKETTAALKNAHYMGESWCGRATNAETALYREQDRAQTMKALAIFSSGFGALSLVAHALVALGLL